MSLFLKRRTRNFKRVFGTKEGKRVLADLIAFCNDVRINSPNPIVSAQMVGRLQVAKHLMAVLDYDEIEVHAMQRTENEIRNSEAA